MLKYLKRLSSNEHETNNRKGKKQRTDILNNNSESGQTECSAAIMKSDLPHLCSEEFNLNVKASVIFPKCWSEEQYKYFTSESTWLEIENRLLCCHEICSGGMRTQKCWN